MSYLRIALMICTLLPAISVQGRQQRDSVLDRVISVRADNADIQAILEQITRESGVFFSFDASILPVQRVSINADHQKVRDILRELFPPERFLLLGRNDHIIISLIQQESSEIIPPDTTALVSQIIITGKIIDRSTREPLSYASISLLRLPIGTITNRDGEYLLKLPPECSEDTLVFSMLGYSRELRKVSALREGETLAMQSVSIRIKEIRVKAVSVEDILDGVRSNIRKNYSMDFQLLTSFYRETIRQDDAYISISEAAMEILKAPYEIPGREDRVRLLKARKSPDVKPFHWVNFKLQGGPYTITMLDVVKNMETFLDPAFQNLYKYYIHQVIWYKGQAVFVLRFKPVRNLDFPGFEGEMYIDRESGALLYAKYNLDSYGLDIAEQSMIRKKPKGYKVKPLSVEYTVDFSALNGRWHLHTAQASVSFRVRSPKDKVNSVFHTVSDLLITNVEETDLKRFPVRDLFTVNDIFTEMSIDYDEEFWGNYNIIKPDEDLQKAVKGFIPETENNEKK